MLDCFWSPIVYILYTWVTIFWFNTSLFIKKKFILFNLSIYFIDYVKAFIQVIANPFPRKTSTPNNAAMEDKLVTISQICLVKVSFVGPTFEVQLKYNLYGFKGLVMCFLEIKQFFISVLNLLVLVNFVFRRKICNFSNPCELRVFGN